MEGPNDVAIGYFGHVAVNLVNAHATKVATAVTPSEGARPTVRFCRAIDEHGIKGCADVFERPVQR